MTLRPTTRPKGWTCCCDPRGADERMPAWTRQSEIVVPCSTVSLGLQLGPAAPTWFKDLLADTAAYLPGRRGISSNCQAWNRLGPILAKQEWFGRVLGELFAEDEEPEELLPGRDQARPVLSPSAAAGQGKPRADQGQPQG